MITSYEIEKSLSSTRYIDERFKHTGTRRTFGHEEVSDVITENLRIKQALHDNGVSVKAKEGELIISVASPSA